jgi:hypothetical protein
LIKRIKKDKYVELSIKAYEYLLDIVIEREMSIQAWLVIPLKSTSGIMAQTKNIPMDVKAITSDLLDNFEPLSIVISELGGAKLNDYEYYRKSLNWDILPNITGVSAYYSEQRRREDIENRGEISRSVLLHYE